MIISSEFTVPKANVMDLVAGRVKLVGRKLGSASERGLFSPIDPFLNCGLHFKNLAKIEQEGLTNKSALSIISKSLLTWGLFNSNFKTPDKISLCGLPIDNISTYEFIQKLGGSVETHTSRIFLFANMHNVNTCVLKPDLMKIYRAADLVMPDGVGLRIGAKLSFKRFKENLNGTNLFPVLCEYAQKSKLPIYLLGGETGVAQACASNMANQYKGLDIISLGNGFRTDYKDSFTLLKNNLETKGRGIVLVGMGVNTQERFIQKHLENFSGYDVFAVGGLFDFYSENISRAPRKWQSSGVEWLWRVKNEPRRLFARYFMGFPAFLAFLPGWKIFQPRESCKEK